MDIYAGDTVFELVLTDKHRIEPRTIYKVMDDKVYTDAAYIDFLDRAEFGNTWFRTEKEAIRAQGRYNRILKQMQSY